LSSLPIKLHSCAPLGARVAPVTIALGFLETSLYPGSRLSACPVVLFIEALAARLATGLHTLPMRQLVPRLRNGWRVRHRTEPAILGLPSLLRVTGRAWWSGPRRRSPR